MLPTVNKQIIRVLNKLKILPWFNFLITCRYRSALFKIPVLQTLGIEIMRQDFADSWLVDLLKKMQHDYPDLTIVDVGVNLGQTLLGIKTIAEKEIKYIGFEPNQVCIYYLEKLIAYNDFKNCQIIPTALSSENDVLSFIASTDTDDAGSIVKELRPDKFQKKKQHVCAYKFDDLEFSKGIDNTIVKIDVEGAELDVIKGMQNFIKTNRPPIICEVLHAHSVGQLKFCEERNEELLSILKSINYKAFRIIKGDKAAEVTGFEKIFEFDKLVYGNNSAKLCDYLFLPEEMSVPKV